MTTTEATATVPVLAILTEAPSVAEGQMKQYWLLLMGENRILKAWGRRDPVIPTAGLQYRLRQYPNRHSADEALKHEFDRRMARGYTLVGRPAQLEVPVTYQEGQFWDILIAQALREVTV